MGARNFLPRCTALFNRIPIESLKICHSNAVHVGKKFLAAIVSAILYCGRFDECLETTFFLYSHKIYKDKQLQYNTKGKGAWKYITTLTLTLNMET